MDKTFLDSGNMIHPLYMRYEIGDWRLEPSSMMIIGEEEEDRYSSKFISYFSNEIIYNLSNHHQFPTSFITL